MQVQPIKTRVFRENEDLIAFILKHIKKVPEKSVLVITSKIVALSEGRTADFKTREDKIKYIKKESSFALETKHTWLTLKDGMIMAAAGIDESNADGKLILLPKDSFESAKKIRNILKKKYKVKNLGIIIPDSCFFPLRTGAIAQAIGFAGFKGVRNYIGKKDIFGRTLKVSRTDVADSLATAAVLCMGEGKEQQPLALITGALVVFTEKVDKKELIIDPEEDLYLPIFGSILRK